MCDTRGARSDLDYGHPGNAVAAQRLAGRVLARGDTRKCDVRRNERMRDYDLVIRGGTVYDGTGQPPSAADVGVLNGQIASVGTQLATGREEIDARGMIVTPGFVDPHTHYDGQVTWEPRLSPSSDHGVTTVVMGNCAIGLAPCRPEQHAMLIHVIAGVEDIPEAVMAEGIPWMWETYPEYLDHLETRRCDIDFASQVAHAAIRVYVMGQRGADREPPSGADLIEMTRLVREAIEAGAIGVSTSRTIAHRTLEGKLAPCETSGEAELMALARGVREAGAGVIEMISDFNDVTVGGATEFGILTRLAREAGCQLSYTLVQVPHDPEGWRTLLALTEEANREGLAIRGQIAPRAVGMCFGLDLSFNPFSFTESYRRIADLPLAERVARMRDPDLRARILSETPSGDHALMLWLTSLYESMFPIYQQPDYEPSPDDRISAVAEARGLPAAELAYDLLLEEDGNRVLYLPITNFADGTLSACLEMMKSDATLIGLGDGGAHYGLICDASYPTFALTHWVRDRKGERLDLSWMINALTRKPALAVGLADRGLIAPGYKADLNVIDFDRLALRRPQVLHDLPAGGRRMVQRASGYHATIVSGVVTYRDGVATGALPGKLVRGVRTDVDEVA